jgi:hypothetical protein
MDYAIYFRDKGDLETAVSMARSAVSSALIWYLYTIIEHTPSGYSRSGEFPLSPIMEGEETITTLLFVGLAGFTIGFIVVGYIFLRVAKKALRASEEV